LCFICGFLVVWCVLLGGFLLLGGGWLGGWGVGGGYARILWIMVISPAEAGKNSDPIKKWPEDRVEPSFAETEQR